MIFNMNPTKMKKMKQKQDIIVKDEKTGKLLKAARCTTACKGCFYVKNPGCGETLCSKDENVTDIKGDSLSLPFSTIWKEMKQKPEPKQDKVEALEKENAELKERVKVLEAFEADCAGKSMGYEQENRKLNETVYDQHMTIVRQAIEITKLKQNNSE